MKLISFVSFFSLFVSQYDPRACMVTTTYEKNEFSEKRMTSPAWLLSYFSFLSFFVCLHALQLPYALIEEGQPTRCGHTLRGVHCRGLARERRAALPSNPPKAKCPVTP